MLLENNLSIEASIKKGQRVVILVQLYLVELLLNGTEEEKKDVKQTKYVNKIRNDAI